MHLLVKRILKALTSFVDWLSPELYIICFHLSEELRLPKLYLHVYKFNSYLTVNRTHMYFKNQPVYDV
jgi:hypothetical protein